MTWQERTIHSSSRLYRVLLLAYPSSFRHEFGDEMLWLFEDCCRDALGKGGILAFLLYCGQVFGDWLKTSIQEQLKQENGDKLMLTQDFDMQFNATLDLFSRALRSGYSVKQVFEIIVEHAPEPTKSAFQRVLSQFNAGTSLPDAINQMGDSLQSAYLKSVIATMNRQRETGGNLADMLDSLNNDFYPEATGENWASEVNFDKH